MQDEARSVLRDGSDPGVERKRAKLTARFNAANTFGAVAGGCLFLDRFTPHRSVENLSGRTRWSLVIWMKRAASAPPDQTSSMRATLAANLKVLRKQRGLSQDALAAAAGIDRTYISALERQRYGAGLDTIELLARALGVEPDRLIKTDCAADQV